MFLCLAIEARGGHFFFNCTVQMIWDPKGESVMDPSGTIDKAMSIHTKPMAANGPSSQDNVSQLKQRISELEIKLQAKGIIIIIMICRKFLYHSGCIII